MYFPNYPTNEEDIQSCNNININSIPKSFDVSKDDFKKINLILNQKLIEQILLGIEGSILGLISITLSILNPYTLAFINTSIPMFSNYLSELFLFSAFVYEPMILSIAISIGVLMILLMVLGIIVFNSSLNDTIQFFKLTTKLKDCSSEKAMEYLKAKINFSKMRTLHNSLEKNGKNTESKKLEKPIIDEYNNIRHLEKN
jgi:hypothetical protein